MVIRNRRLEKQCDQMHIDFNRDLRLIPTRAMSRSSFCTKWETKWETKLRNTNCDSLKRQLRSFCSRNNGIN